MKRKRLNRDGWGFMFYPYYQIRVDDDLFHGAVCLIRFTDGEAIYDRNIISYSYKIICERSDTEWIG